MQDTSARLNLKQISAIHDPSRFTFWLAGRRGGKTTGIEEKIKKTVPEWIKKTPPGADLIYVGPTNQQAMELIWDKLEESFWKLKWPYHAWSSKQRIEFPERRNIYVIGAEKIRRVRGKQVYHAFMDEIAYYESDMLEVWDRGIRPTLTDLAPIGSGATSATTPNGKGSPAYKFYERMIKPGSSWSFHHWFTKDNPAITEQELEDARKELDEKSFRQEYEATWESYEGLAYYNFNHNIHVKKQPPIETSLPLILHFDFNVNPTTLVLGQRDNKMYRFKKEYSFVNSSTPATVTAFCEDHKHLKDSLLIKIRGDASGRNRSSNTGYSDYHYAQELLSKYGFQYQYEVPASNPPIVDRVQHFNNYLMNSFGEHRVEIDPSCVDTIRDLESQSLNGRFPSDKNNLGHKADAVGYGIYWDWINTREIRSSTIQL